MNTVFSQYGDPNDASDPTTSRPKQRRKRDVLACAECRRLKLKCDKSWPCKTCVRRGCSAICPMGSMAPGKAGRMIVANTETLHARIATLCSRIRDLEDALENAVGPVHPQLADALRQLKAPLSADAQQDPAPAAHNADAPQNGRIESQHVSSSSNSQEASPKSMEELLLLGRQFPLPIEEEDLIDAARTIQDIRAILPPLSQGQQLTTSFYMGFGATFLMLPQPLFERIMHEVYELEPDRTDIDAVHKLALVFITFSLGSFHNSQLGVETHESDMYFHLAMSLYCIRSAFESDNDVTIMGMAYVAIYARMTNRSSSSWTTLGIVTKLIFANNLHRDPSRFGFQGEVATSKSWLFWELYSYDLLFTFISMRPPVYNMQYVDCPFPELDVNSSDPATRMTANFIWKWRFSKDIVPTLMEEIFSCKVPTYAKVLEMDKMVRMSWVPDCLQLDRQHPAELFDGIRSAAIQRFSVLWFRELALLFLHRNLLAIAVTEGRDNPLQHRYSPSVLAAFRSAYKLCTALRSLIASPDTQGQHICYFGHGFAAISVLGSIAVLSPQSSFGQLAGTEVLAISEIYEAATMPIPSRIRTWLVYVKERILQERAGMVLPPLPTKLCVPDWEDFGSVDRLISTRALKTHVRKECRRTLTSQAQQEGTCLSTGTMFPDFLALSLSDPKPGTSFMNDPILMNYFPPPAAPTGSIDTLPPSQPLAFPLDLPPTATNLPQTTVDFGDLFSSFVGEPPADKGEMGSSAEINVQWDRFLNSIGLVS